MKYLCLFLICLALGNGLPLNAQTGSPDAITFLQEMGNKAAVAEKTGISVVQGKDGWLFLTTELSSLGIAQPFWGAQAETSSHIIPAPARDPLAAILDFQQQLAKRDIELLLVPVPAKATIYPDMIAEYPVTPASRLDIYQEQFYSVLKEHGIKVLDLTPIFLQQRSVNNRLLFCKTDTHWSGQACVLAAKAIADEVKNRPWMKAVPKQAYQIKDQQAEIACDLAGMLGDATRKETLTFSVVQEMKGGKPMLVDSWRESPVVLLGDSHNLIFHGGGDMLYTGAGLFDHLAEQLGFPADLVAVRGSGATPARKNLARRKDNLAGKRLVIWCFTVREFTEGQGWYKVPVIQEAP